MKNLIAVLLSCFAVHTGAQATVHTYEFTASMTAIADFAHLQNVDSAEGVAAGKIVALGDKVTGHFSYDDATPQAPSWWGPTDLSQTLGGSQFTVPGSSINNVAVTIVPSAQSFTSVGSHFWTYLTVEHYQDYRFFVQGSDGATQFGVSFGTTSHDLDNHDLHMPDGLSLSLFDKSFASFGWTRPSDGATIWASARMDTLTEVSAVPEPETYAMLAAGLALVGFAARRRRA